jgi:hypothetical protein
MWTDASSRVWTLPLGAGAPVMHPAVTTRPAAFDGASIYLALTDRLATVPLEGGAETTIAMALPASYPAQGSESPPGPSTATIGPKRIYWTECWGNGGSGPNGSSLMNWVLRAIPVGGTTAETIDSFTWSPSSPTTGTCPTLGTDGVAVYWTHEGSLMRVCE